jgi:hypothetical protein
MFDGADRDLAAHSQAFVSELQVQATVAVTLTPPFGLALEPANENQELGCRVKGFQALPAGAAGSGERSSLIRVGHVLLSIDGVDIAAAPFRQALSLFETRQARREPTTFVFTLPSTSPAAVLAPPNAASSPDSDAHSVASSGSETGNFPSSTPSPPQGQMPQSSFFSAVERIAPRVDSMIEVSDRQSVR